MTDGDREFETDETIQRIETKSDPVIGAAAPLGTPAAEEAVVTESETIRQREDGAIERDVVRHERRRRMSGDRLALLLFLLALLIGAGIAAWWFLTQEDTTTVPTVEGLTIDRAVATLADENLRSDTVTQPSDAPPGNVFRQSPAPGSEVDEESTVPSVSVVPETATVLNAVGLPMIGPATASSQRDSRSRHEMYSPTTRQAPWSLRSRPPGRMQRPGPRWRSTCRKAPDWSRCQMSSGSAGQRPRRTSSRRSSSRTSSSCPPIRRKEPSLPSIRSAVRRRKVRR